jgi:TPR repeat protein
VTKIARCIAVAVVLLALKSTSASASQSVFVPAPYASAARVIRAADRGNMNAEAQLAWMYANGRGVPQDFVKAAKWYYSAAVQGHGWAQYELGMLYNKGLGVRRDYILSYVWLNLSASQAVGDDHDFKARMRDSVATKMTPAQMAVAQQMAIAWYTTR